MSSPCSCTDWWQQDGCVLVGVAVSTGKWKALEWKVEDFGVESRSLSIVRTCVN